MVNTEFAIISPCVGCSNQRASPDPTTGKMNYCPRRYWQSLYAALLASTDSNDNIQAANVRHLALTGVASNDSSDSFGGNLVNPVYDNDGNNILVWCAAVADNDGDYDPSSNITTPTILTGPAQFDTDKIVCRLRPFVPETNEASLFQSGALRQWETVSITPNISQITQDGQGTEAVGGSVSRATLLRQSPRKQVYDHNSPEGV